MWTAVVGFASGNNGGLGATKNTAFLASSAGNSVASQMANFRKIPIKNELFTFANGEFRIFNVVLAE